MRERKGKVLSARASSPTIIEYGHNHDHDRVEVYRKPRLPEELELALEERRIEFS
jgi:hypothetical protein